MIIKYYDQEFLIYNEIDLKMFLRNYFFSYNFSNNFI